MEETISYYVKDFYQKKSLISLYKAIYLIFKEGRFVELLYGTYCFAFFHPSKLDEVEEKNQFYEAYLSDMLSRKYNGYEGLIYTDYLKSTYGNEYPYHLIPKDFRMRLPSIYNGGDWLLLGEYGDASGRLCILTKTTIKLIDSYNKIKGFRHIHCIHQLNENELLIATGDDKKYLDVWTKKGSEINFSKRLIKYFAGYTAAVEIDGEHYFGSDFSQRPNYIYRLRDKRKFFFPKDSFTMFVMYFEVLEDRYIVSLNRETINFGGKAIAIFDTQKEVFVYSKRLR